jgi:hypothetical protein
MTEDEKNVTKYMSRVIFDLTRLKAVYEFVLKRNVEDWQEKVEAANASGPLQEFAQSLENARQATDLLIDQNNLSALPSRYSKDGLVD